MILANWALSKKDLPSETAKVLLVEWQQLNAPCRLATLEGNHNRNLRPDVPDKKTTCEAVSARFTHVDHTTALPPLRAACVAAAPGIAKPEVPSPPPRRMHRSNLTRPLRYRRWPRCHRTIKFKNYCCGLISCGGSNTWVN